jgi:hypothetical protein
MRAIFKLMSLLRWVRAAGRGKLPQRYVRIKAMRVINHRIR